MHMDIDSHVTMLQEQLAATAAVAGDEARESVSRLAPVLAANIRLAFLGALSEAAAEITRDLAEAGAHTSVDARLDGTGICFVVEPLTEVAPDVAESADEGDEVARVSLRLPADLKTRADAAASEAGQSLNTWLVGAVRGALVRSASAWRPSMGRHYRGWN